MSEEPVFDLPPPAPWWDLMRARIFGKRKVVTTEGVTVVAYIWRGCIYVSRITVNDAGVVG